MKYTDLRDFMHQLEARGLLQRVAAPLSPRLEITELSDRVLKAGGPALLLADSEALLSLFLSQVFAAPRAGSL